MSAEMVSGDIAWETPPGEEPDRFRDVSGDICLVVPPDAACTVIGKNVSGRARMALPARQASTATAAGAEVQDGVAEVRFESVSGNLRVGAAGEVKRCR